MMSPRSNDEITDVIRYHWDSRARTFDNELGHGVHSIAQRRAWLDLLSQMAGPAPKTILDAGCGTGVLSLLLSELGHTVTGIDLAPEMLQVAQQKARQAGMHIDFRNENASALHDADGTYDIVLARHVVWNLPDPGRAVDEWLRVLRRDGFLALIEGKWANPDQIGARPKTLLRLLRGCAGQALALISGKRKRKKAYLHKYSQVEAQLPFSGGPHAEQLSEFLKTHGIAQVSIEPLMSEVLWGEVPRFPRYLAIARR